jgi:diguanylate cyclase (GGDEF)-like protein
MNCQSSSETLTIDGVPCILSVTQDVTSRRRADQEIRKLAHYDTLTGLSNRTFFLEQLQHAVALAGRNGTMLALLFIDLDHFKDVNDRLGHAAGDAVLAQLGVRMVQSLRQSDIAGRIGGDEFVVLLEACADRKDVDEVANKLMNAIVQPMRIRDETCRLTASMGVACLPENGLDADTLLKHADTAMYRAKRHGRNGICFYSDAEGAGDA